MTSSFRISHLLLAVTFCISLFLLLRYTLVNSSPITWSHVQLKAQPLPINQMALSDLEEFLRGVLEEVRNGEALSFGREEALRGIREALLERLAYRPTLLARLLAIIDEILLLNDDLIYPADGEQHTDEDR